MIARAGRARGRGRAFTLIELMIATIILGIGLVMVATIFPVAVSHTRDAVQKSVVQAVADSAIQTLRLRLDSVIGNSATAHIDTSDLPGDRPHSNGGTGQTGLNGASIPTWPSAYDTDSNPGNGLQGLASGFPRGFRVIRAVNIRDFPDPKQQINSVAFFPVNSSGGLFDFNHEIILAPSIRSQFANTERLWADTSFRMKSHWDISGGSFPKIDLLERVYPPVEPSWPDDPMNNAAGNGFPRLRDVSDAANRRYCWTALGAPGAGTTGPQGAPYQLRIFVMFRSELTARYAAQEVAPNFPPRHIRPVPSSTDEDTLLPQPWLVKFDDLDGATGFHTNYTAQSIRMKGPFVAVPLLPPGTIICTEEVGDLLPVGAMFIDFELGRAHTVLRNIPEPSNPADLRRLFVAPDSELNAPDVYNNVFGSAPRVDGMNYYYPDFPDYAWVIPPPIVRTGTGREDHYFEGRSPVVAVVSATLPRN
jgi:prepilin-type N-terminal cleavage/methylation domain-containing protein